MVRFEVSALAYQSQDITFPDWIVLFTLCLAPLIAHVLSGAPAISFLSPTRPAWHDQICHYNPTSILWRYAAIADRRIRARTWSPHTMAASNAIFWTSNGWDGHERMVAFSRPLAVRLPEKPRVDLASVEMLWTVIVTAQGASAVYSLAGGLSGAAYFNSTLGLDTIFFPLAVFGLLRLFAAFWITDDFHFAYATRNSVELNQINYGFNEENKEPYSLGGFSNSRDSLDRTETLAAPIQESGQFRSTTFWPSRIFRVAYLLPNLGLWVLTSFFIFPYSGKYSSTMSAYLVGVFFFIFFTISLGIYGFYFIRGGTKSTIIPCISTTWYRLYTLFLFVSMVIMMIVAAIETRKAPCGRYTSLGGVPGDLKACWDGIQVALPVGSELHGPFGLASNNAVDSDVGTSIAENTWVVNFTGTCLGKVSEASKYSTLYEGNEWFDFMSSLE